MGYTYLLILCFGSFDFFLEYKAVQESWSIIKRVEQSTASTLQESNTKNNALDLETEKFLPENMTSASNTDVLAEHSMSDSNFCFNEGSQHQIAIEMMNYSSPVGSPSYKKLLSVLRTNSYFYMDLGPNTFEKNDPSISRILTGYGLKRTQGYSPSTTLVETAYSKSRCPLSSKKCQNQARILIQSEQYFKDPIKLCHECRSCVVFEFSDHK